MMATAIVLKNYDGKLRKMKNVTIEHFLEKKNEKTVICGFS